jgi:glycosyltransferase involved in cell wall biosynthesis
MPIRPFVPVPAQQKADLRKKLGLDVRTRVLLCVGRLSREKGHADLIHAFPEILRLSGKTPLRLVLVGDGPERRPIEELCRSLRLTDNVILAGQQENIADYFSIADAFILPSHTEGCPNVLLEAMAAGVPVVATRVGGVSEIVTSGQDAILVEKQDRAGMAAAVAEVLENRELRHRLVSSALGIVSRKTPESYFRSIASIFGQACANGN